MTIEALREVVSRLSPSAHSLAALAAALHVRASGKPLHPELQPHVDQVLSALGGSAAFDALTEGEAAPLLGELRTFAFSNLRLLFPTSPRTGDTPLEADAMIAAGQVGSSFLGHLERAIAPKVEGLVERLAAPDAAFLDVGVGVAALSIAMARRWPALRVVGVDHSAPALRIARQEVKAAELDARIELREQAAEDLRDSDAFDLA